MAVTIESTKPTNEFTPPGPGPWELETTHYTRPPSRFVAEAMVKGFPRGFAEGTERYGVLLSHFKPAIVNGFVYQQPVAFGAPEGAMGPPPKLVLQLLTRLHPKMRARIKASERAFETKLWRKDLERWDEVVKPETVNVHRTLQAIDPATLDDKALAEHVARMHDRVEQMIYQHHQFTIPSCFPIGDYLAHAKEWTKKPLHELLSLLRGSSPISRGAAADELEMLGEAIRKDATARALLTSGASHGEILQKIREHSGSVGEVARAYLDIVGYRSLGYDIGERFGLELPEVLVSAIRIATEEGIKPPTDAALASRTAAVRASVPEEHRAKFDELLGEARLVNRLRDERGVYSDGWALGLARRAVLEVGKRFAQRGTLSNAEHAIEASRDELVAMLRGEKPVSDAELAARAKHRATANVAEAPAFLRAMPAPPPNPEWLPEGGRRAARGVTAFIAGLFEEPPPEVTATSVKGLPVSPGTYEGTARIVVDQADFGRIQQGDVLVTRATSPYFNVVLPLLGAIVTDRGGQLCHAAIVAREYGIPGVVGSREATKVVRDGARVRVDGTTGVVQVIG